MFGIYPFDNERLTLTLNTLPHFIVSDKISVSLKSTLFLYVSLIILKLEKRTKVGLGLSAIHHIHQDPLRQPPTCPVW